MAADDLSTPLGQSPVKRRRIALPVRISHVIAGALALCLLVFAGWIVAADDPFGGEPMAIVSAEVRPPAQGGKPDAVGTPAASTSDASIDKSSPAGPADKGSPAGGPTPSAASGQTITIIDGMSGKRQEVPIPAADAKGQGGLTDQRLVETSRHGTIPKIAANGTRPADVYARPLQPTFDKVAGPRVAIVVGGLGIGAAGTFEALAKLSRSVTLGFAPYGTDLPRWVVRARGEGHEVLLQVPMEPFEYPDNDPGPQTLLTTLTATQNLDRLHWFMSRFQGYIGIANYMGARFTASESAISPLLRETAKRGLVYFDDGTSARSVASQIAGANNAPFAKADIVLDADPTPTAIDAALTRLETMARERGMAVGTATALPASIDRIAHWTKAAASRGITLVPVSMVAIKPKST
ncbi:MAG: divergent polysaccharide deacetylase family protein [Xanthobacteraceae bacterium]